MREFPGHFLQAYAGQLELMSKGSSFISRANASMSFISHRANKSYIGPRGSLVRQPTVLSMGQCEVIIIMQ